MISLEGRRIIITDRTVGGLELGTTIARVFPQLGASVAFVDCLCESNGESTGGVEGTRAFFTINLLEEDSILRGLSAAVKVLGGLDVIIHNAQFAPATGKAELLDTKTWTEVIASNVTGTFLINRAVLPYLLEKGGAIINQISTGAVVGAPGKAAFSAAKGAVLAWTRTIAMEWGAYGIRVNAVAPALMSAKYAEALANAPEEVRLREELLTKTTVALGGKRGYPEPDYAPIMAFLASEEAHHLTGQVIPIDGGMLMMR